MISRRNLLKSFLMVPAACVLLSGRVLAMETVDRRLDLYNIHTGESLKTTYCSSGVYDYEALEDISYLMRCHYTNKVKPIDVRVLDILSNVKDTVGKNKQIHVISGYRSPEYNGYLRSIGRHVASHSLHMKGDAIDFTIDGVDNDHLAGIARSFVAGGVGTYPDFVHIDCGRVRYWAG
jgi:uncharacterized protein YcbK (DUF882 family)